MTDADVVILYRELQDLIERAAVKEREAAVFISTAATRNRDAQDLRRRADVIASQLGIT